MASKKRPRSDECPADAKYNAVYYVNVAGHRFVIEGNEATGKFRWTNHPDNDCLGQYVVLFSRMGIIQAVFEDGVTRKMMVFDNHGDGNCKSLALLLYLCAAGYGNVNMTLRSLLQMLTQYIQDHIDDPKPRDYLFHSYREFFDLYADRSAETIKHYSMKKKGLTDAHSDAFAHVFNVPVRTFEIGFHPAMKDRQLRGEWGDYSSAMYNKLPAAHVHFLTIPSDYNMAYVDDPKACNLLKLEQNCGWNHDVLLGHIELIELS
jgi:hypothetical protein